MVEKQFANKVVFVTGATSGIGRACASAFGKAGANVVCVGRNEEALKQISGDIRKSGNDVLPIRADVSLESDANTAVATALKTLGGIDVLVNAAGHISSGT